MKIFFGLLLFIALPNFYTRVAVACFFLYQFFSKPRMIRKKYTFLFLSLLFSFAYIFSPYWAVFQNPAYKIGGLISLIVFGLFWSYLASSNVSFTNIKKKPFWLLALALLIYLINYRPLKADIPWRGDEDFHINLTIDLFSYLKNGGGFAIDQVLRYPYLSKWASLLFVAPALYTDVKLYRIIPFLSVLLIAFFLFDKFEEKLNKPILSLLFSVSIVSVPLVYFYSSVLYLEMPIVLLTMICIFDIRSVLKLPYEKLMTRPSWYCLLLLSFLKETVIVFLLLIFALRLIYQMKINIRSTQIVKILFSEVALCLLVLSPCAIYLIFRKYFSIHRAFGGQINLILNIENYIVILKALFNQLGSLLIAAILGFYLIFKQRKIYIGFSQLTLLAGIILFFMMDNSMYLGYSRWNLYIIPIIIYVSFRLLISIKELFQIISVLLILFTNILFCPILADGTRLPNWGSPKMDTAEYTYPYRQAVKLLGSDRSTGRLLLFGQNYPYYGLRFYLEKYDFHPEIIQYEIGYTAIFDKEAELSVFNNFFRDFTGGKLDDKAMRADTIIYHSMNNLILDRSSIYGGKYKIAAKISNPLHSLYIFKRILL